MITTSPRAKMHRAKPGQMVSKLRVWALITTFTELLLRQLW